MARLTLAVALLLLAGCASMEPRPAPLDREEIVRLSKAGEPPAALIRRLQESRSVLLLSGSDIVRLHQDGVPQEVLDYLQRVQIDAIRRRDAFDRAFAWPYTSSFHCPWPAYGFHPRPLAGLGRWPYC
jgi:hypothetical protein